MFGLQGRCVSNRSDKKEKPDYRRQKNFALSGPVLSPLVVRGDEHRSGPRSGLSPVRGGSQLCLLTWHQLSSSSSEFFSLAMASFSTPSGSRISTCRDAGRGALVCQFKEHGRPQAALLEMLSLKTTNPHLHMGLPMAVSVSLSFRAPGGSPTLGMGNWVGSGASSRPKSIMVPHLATSSTQKPSNS